MQKSNEKITDIRITWNKAMICDVHEICFLTTNIVILLLILSNN